MLALWARWARLTGLGYPTSSAFVFKVRGLGRMPDEALQVDHVMVEIQRDPAEQQHAFMLRHHYLEQRPAREKIQALRMSSRTYYNRLDEAQWAVHARLAK